MATFIQPSYEADDTDELNQEEGTGKTKGILISALKKMKENQTQEKKKINISPLPSSKVCNLP